MTICVRIRMPAQYTFSSHDAGIVTLLATYAPSII
ncbi:hypothetical protein BofuT4_uP084420.1 [Botrytis cinerea T4]|uniref:Uncharacterized protein n=1 Tax=Botryotinia fuckeliana (strain T4) TaxID=999810 RepID=G2YJK1_BOTF4|nr:hypothetical protein BofuT4_uP084420.1 [Botrytis cinerea T4]